jgi:UDP-N-acetylglucosamine--N-acetylmuramyl-(pentapeptide) pyrophosphoryl-undecaprenol N-acetylglucosamine transferase
MLLCKKDEARDKLGLDGRPFVLSFGGSLGARKINENIIDFIKLHCREGRYQHTHATGKYGWRWVPGLLKEKGVSLEEFPQIKLVEYISDMPLQMAAADLVICRAGAITLSELSAMGRPAILIPSPNVANNHQYYNALALEEKGAAVVIEEKFLTGETLKEKVDELLDNRENLQKMSEKAFDSALLNASSLIYQNVMELLAPR